MAIDRGPRKALGGTHALPNQGLPFFEEDKMIPHNEKTPDPTAHGVGSMVIPVHCSGSSRQQWRSLAEILWPQFQVCPLDLIGCGATDDWHGRGPITLSAQAMLVEAVAVESFGPVHLVGHSHGGAVTITAAMKLGERVASLTLIEPSLFHILRRGNRSDRALHKEIETIANTVGAAVLSGNFHGAMACFIDYWNGPGAWDRLKPTARERLAAHAVKTAMDFGALFAESTAPIDYARITAPTLILRATNSPAPSRRICEILAQILPDANIHSVANAGHMLPITHAETVNPIIEDHIESRRMLKSLSLGKAA